MFERGSEWRRWDLHMHTPNTKKNDQYQGDTLEEKWDNFYNHIASYIGNGEDCTKNIAVIGITDYLSIENFKKVITDNRMPKSIFLLPNVEMRIMPTGADSPVNIHFLFNPSMIDELEERFFSQIKFEYVGRSFSASHQGLISFGKQFDTDLSDEMAYKKGIEMFVPTYEAIYEVFKNDKELKENTLIGVANSTSDGASGIVRGEGGGQLTGVREAVYRMCDFIFSSNDGDIKYFLGKKSDSPEEVISKYGSLKPCFHGSDAHSLEKVFEPDGQRYCWVKADASFNGLLQVIYEPEARVRIAASCPEGKSDYQVIDHVKIMDDNFAQSPIVFNDKLTCIIGGKSTGKSLLLQNMARAIDAKQVEEKIQKSEAYTKQVSGISVVWKDGEKSESGQVDTTHKIVYIPQTYLNRLTDKKEEATEIDRIIQDIILMDSGCQNAYEQMNKKIRQYKPELDKKIYDLISIYSHMQEIISKRAEVGSPEGIKKEIEKLQKQKDEISQKISISEEEISRYDCAIATIAELNSEIEALDIDKQIIDSMNSIFIPVDIEIGLSDAIRNSIIDFQDAELKDINIKWEKKRETLRREIRDKRLVIEKRLLDASKVRDDLGVKIHENETLSRVASQIKDETEKKKLVDGLTEQYNEEEKRYKQLIKELSKTYSFFYDSHFYYAQIVNESAHINTDGLEFSVKVPLRMEALSNVVKSSINNQSLKKYEVSFNEDMDEKSLTGETLEKLIDDIVQDRLKLLKGKTVESVLREILQDWYIVSYDVKLDNDTINQMSPGKKALVLLKLLISMADSKCPILIDQPEDDLDNRSIYDELIPFIREKKIMRQIIIVTHNANVVLGGDAEEVIVANQSGKNSPNNSKRFEYRSGSIENNYPLMNDDGSPKEGILNTKGIQQHICDILEGGERAFDLRRSKYRIS